MTTVFGTNRDERMCNSNEKSCGCVILKGNRILLIGAKVKGYPNSGWGWVSALLDGTVPFEDLCRWLDESYDATLHEPGNMNISLEKRK